MEGPPPGDAVGAGAGGGLLQLVLVVQLDVREVPVLLLHRQLSWVVVRVVARVVVRVVMVPMVVLMGVVRVVVRVVVMLVAMESMEIEAPTVLAVPGLVGGQLGESGAAHRGGPGGGGGAGAG